MEKRNRINVLSAVVLQIVTILQSLILPRLILQTFGSEINGLVGSINQFLGFVSLLEGGAGAVVLSSLYKPIEEKDEQRVKTILCSCQKFFLILSLLFITYTAVLSFTYPFFSKSSFNFSYVSTLIWILSISTFTQYVFSITYRLFLHANQELYKVNIISIFIVAINFLISVVFIFLFPNIHILKLVSSLIYFLAPIIYRIIIPTKYRVGFIESIRTQEKIKNRWSGFGQNLAHYINMNTDIIVITIFLSLLDVSVYSIYLMSISALRSLIVNISGSYQSVLGKDYASGDIVLLKKHFSKFEIYSWNISFAVFGTTLLLNNQFVSLYTSGINDANYYQPIFALIIVIANLVFCLREPYRILVYSAGLFKETNIGAILEAVINIVLSIALVYLFGLVGVAIGTLVAALFRLLYFYFFLQKNILRLSKFDGVDKIVSMILFLTLNILVYFLIPLEINSILSFILYGFVITISELAVAALLLFSLSKIKLILSRKNELV